jgi:hypothetical protein
LAKLLVDSGALSAHSEVLVSIKHFDVHVHKTTLEKLDHFQGYKQGNWYKVAIKKISLAAGDRINTYQKIRIHEPVLVMMT